MGQGKSVLQRKVRKLRILMIVGVLLTALPFHVSADAVDFDVPYISASAYAYFSFHNMELEYNVTATRPDGYTQYKCSTWTDSSHTSCMLWSAVSNAGETIHYNNIGYMKGTYKTIETATWQGAGYLNKNEPFVVAFASPRQVYFVNNPTVSMYRVDSQSVDTTCNIEVKTRFSGTDRLYLYIITSTLGGSYHINFPEFNNVYGAILPYYFGYLKYMTADMQKFLLGYTDGINVNDDYTHELINEGTEASQSSASSLSDENDDLSQSVSDYTTLENTFNNDFNNAFNNINFNNNFLSSSNLLSSMNWVRTQYNRMTSSNAIGSLIQYSLLFGLGLIVIGRQKK